MVANLIIVIIRNSTITTCRPTFVWGDIIIRNTVKTISHRQFVVGDLIKIRKTRPKQQAK